MGVIYGFYWGSKLFVFFLYVFCDLFFSSPCQAEIALGMHKDDQSFRNLSLSFRGAERQAPSVLQIALRFSKIMERQSGSVSGNTETRLKRVVASFNASPGLHVKHQIDNEKERTVLNLIVGTCKDHGCQTKCL